MLARGVPRLRAGLPLHRVAVRAGRLGPRQRETADAGRDGDGGLPGGGVARRGRSFGGVPRLIGAADARRHSHVVLRAARQAGDGVRVGAGGRGEDVRVRPAVGPCRAEFPFHQVARRIGEPDLREWPREREGTDPRRDRQRGYRDTAGARPVGRGRGWQAVVRVRQGGEHAHGVFGAGREAGDGIALFDGVLLRRRGHDGLAGRAPRLRAGLPLHLVAVRAFHHAPFRTHPTRGIALHVETRRRGRSRLFRHAARFGRKAGRRRRRCAWRSPVRYRRCRRSGR